jgi:hypothetical protein
MVAGVSSLDACSTGKERYALVAPELWILASTSIVSTQICLLFLSIIHIQIHTHLKWGEYE